ncbi:MAG: pantoate--beta-alanine ligase [Bacteroidales bacterium]|nr:pantoate--beta-alanine ligase [Bacteroidales bacterium]
MQLIESIHGLKEKLAFYKKNGKIGFVPTMGALHKGHLSLVNRCAEENQCSVVSIYVNPTQFNDKNDLNRYPRNLELDLGLLANCNCDFVFAPGDDEMYPVPDMRKFNFGLLETVMEGKFRPGHFNGVAQIVSKLFDAVQPDRAYFGLKDFQQLAVIKKMAIDYNYPVEIVPCDIVREADGLAMSSRNALLEPEKRNAAPFIYNSLLFASELSKTKSPGEIKQEINMLYQKNTELELEYFEIVDNNSLLPVEHFGNKNLCTACIAVFAGKIRLIDNIQFNS